MTTAGTESPAAASAAAGSPAATAGSPAPVRRTFQQSIIDHFQTPIDDYITKTLGVKETASLAPSDLASMSKSLIRHAKLTVPALAKLQPDTLKKAFDPAIKQYCAAQKAAAAAVGGSPVPPQPPVPPAAMPAAMNGMNAKLLGMYKRKQEVADQASGAAASAPSADASSRHSDKVLRKRHKNGPQAAGAAGGSGDAARSRRPNGGSNGPQDLETEIQNRIIEKVSEHNWTVPEERLSDMGGIDDCKQQIDDLIGTLFRHPTLYAKMGVQPPRGVLLHGPPGCGKSFLARAIAGEMGVPLLDYPAPTITSGVSGDSEKRLREIFKMAQDYAPCILFFDEVEIISGKRESAQRQMETRIVGQLLSCLDSLSREGDPARPVLVIGATNRADSLDPAFRRSGRFDKEIGMGIPNQEARMDILDRITKNMRLAPDVHLEELAKRTPGFVGADLQSLCSEAGLLAIQTMAKFLEQQASELVRSTKHASKAAKAKRALTLAAAESSHVMDVETMPSEDGTVSCPPMVIDPDAPMADSPVVLTDAVALSTTEPAPRSAQEEEADDERENDDEAQLLAEAETEAEAALLDDENASLKIQFKDFLAALTKVQPSATREGFATRSGVTWDDIGALGSIQQELRMSVVLPIRYPKMFAQVGVEQPMGILLYGPPGCGKTLLAKAVASESHCNFISVNGPELLNKYVGESERAIRQVFDRARASRPCVIFFDEMDAICPTRSNDGDSQSSSRLVNTLLVQMNGMTERKGVYLIAATNRPDMMDPAMMRPGRFDKTLYVDLPSASERVDILKTLTKRTPLDADVDLVAVAAHPAARHLSGADLAALVREAAVTALKEAMPDLHRLGMAADAATRDAVLPEQPEPVTVTVTQRHFLQSLQGMRPSVSKSDLHRYQKLRQTFGTGSNGGASGGPVPVSEPPAAAALPASPAAAMST